MSNVIKFPVKGGNKAIEDLLDESTDDVIFMGYKDDGAPFLSTTMSVEGALDLIEECQNMLMNVDWSEE